GRVVSRLTTDVDVLQEMFAAGAMTIVLDFLGLLGILGFMLWINWALALVSLALLPVMVFAIDYFRRMARITYRRIRERIGRINGAGLAELGTVVAFIQYIQKFFVPIRDFSAKYAVMQSSMTAAERIFALLDLETEPVPAHARVPARVRGEIEFEHVWFAYRDAEEAGARPTAPATLGARRGDAAPPWILRDVSFRIPAGEHVAIVGATGAGKTTLIKLLDRLYDVQRGRILVDGIDVRDWDPTALRRRIAVVLQDVFLFSGPVEAN